MAPASSEQGSLGVVVVGASGRLGAHACRLLEQTPGLHVAARLGRADCDVAQLAASGATLGLDLTRAGLGRQHGTWMLEAGLRPVIGTSGVDADETTQLHGQALELGLGGIVVPNFSMGMCLLQRAAVLVADFFPRVEIVESHHAGKLDAPSGTALDTSARLQSARQAQDAEPIPIHSLRLPGVLANQEVVLSAPGEVLRLIHETYSLDVYSSGILLALRFAAQARGVARGLDAALSWANDVKQTAD